MLWFIHLLERRLSRQEYFNQITVSLDRPHHSHRLLCRQVLHLMRNLCLLVLNFSEENGMKKQLLKLHMDLSRLQNIESLQKLKKY